MTTLEDLPPSWSTQFDGEALDRKTGVSAVVATVDAAGWPHLAFLSAGEVMVRENRLALALWPDSTTAGDLRRNGRASLYAAADGAVWEARIACTPEGEGAKQTRLALFRGRIDEVRRHGAPYAVVEGLIAFRLTDTLGSVARWRAQTALLREILI